MYGLLASLMRGTSLARGAAVFSRSTKMLGVGRTAAAYGARAGKAALGGAKATARVGWKGAKILGVGAALLWRGGGARREIQLGNEDSYGAAAAGTGTGTSTNTSAVVTELPGLKSPEQAEKISAPTVATIIQSIDRLSGIATGIADNLLNLQNILVGQINQSSDIAREAMIEGRAMPQVAAQESGTSDLEGALDDIAAASNPQPSLVQKLIDGALATWGIGSLVKGFFTKSAATKAAEARAAVVASSKGAATAASRTAAVLRTTGKVARFAGKVAAPVAAVTGTMGAMRSYNQGRAGDFLLESGTALTGASGIAAMFGPAAAVIAPAALALGTALGLASIPFLAGEEVLDEVVKRQLAFSSRIPLYVRGGSAKSVPDHAVLAGVNVEYDHWPKELKELYHYYIPYGHEADAKKVEANKAKYIAYENAIASAQSLADVANASTIISGKDAGFNAVESMVADPEAARKIADNWGTPGVIEAKIAQKMNYKYYQAEDLKNKAPIGGSAAFQKAENEFLDPLNTEQIAKGQTRARAASAAQNKNKQPMGANVDPMGPNAGRYDSSVGVAPPVEEFGSAKGIKTDMAALSSKIEGKVYAAEPRKAMPDIYAIPYNKQQNALQPIGPESVDPSKYAPGLKLPKQSSFTDFMLPTKTPTADSGYNKQGEPVELGHVPNPSFDDALKYDKHLFFVTELTAAS